MIADMLEPGTRIGRYRIVQSLDAGMTWRSFVAAFGEPPAESRVQLKIHNRTLPDELDIVAVERRISALVDHPNLLRCTAGGEVDGYSYVVYDLVDGLTYATLLARLRTRGGSTPPLGVAGWIAHRTLLALAHLHEAKDKDDKPLAPIHGAVNPRHVLLTRKGAVKLGGYGGATLADQSSMPRLIAVSDTAYVAPELVRGDPFDQRADLFSVALVLYEAISGRAASGRPGHQLIDLVRAAKLPPLAELRPNVGDLSPIVMRALAADPAARPATAKELAQALSDVLMPRWGQDPDRQLVRLIADCEAPAAVKVGAPDAPVLHNVPPTVSEPRSVAPARSVAPPVRSIEPAPIEPRSVAPARSVAPPARGVEPLPAPPGPAVQPTPSAPPRPAVEPATRAEPRSLPKIDLPKIDLPSPPVVEPHRAAPPQPTPLPKIDLPPLELAAPPEPPSLRPVLPPAPPPVAASPAASPRPAAPPRPKPVGPPPDARVQVPSLRDRAEVEDVASRKTVILSTIEPATGELAPQHTQAVPLELLGLAPVAAPSGGEPGPPTVIVDENAPGPIISDDTPIVMEPAPLLDSLPRMRPTSAAGVISDDTPIVMETSLALDAPSQASQLSRPEMPAARAPVIDLPPPPIADDTPIIMETSLALEEEGSESTFTQLKSAERDRLRALAARAMAVQPPAAAVAPGASSVAPTNAIEEHDTIPEPRGK
jgi:eukaryotic-like serine/threonine-protein kinase